MSFPIASCTEQEENVPFTFQVQKVSISTAERGFPKAEIKAQDSLVSFDSEAARVQASVFGAVT